MAILTFAAFFLNVSLVVEFLAIPETVVTFLCVHSMLKSEQKNGTNSRHCSSTNFDLRLKMITQSQNEMSEL